ncbi:MAG: hypothetical protein IJC30_01525 [Alphaproteobacteria bacterium]|nr:hypothetical protein [Alphaproteobacteria bacterium]
MSYKKTENLMDLAIWMQSSRKGIGLMDIMKRFKVSRRTAERMRDLILERFHQTQEVDIGDHKKRWRIPSETLSEMIHFTRKDISFLKKIQTSFEKQDMSAEAVHLGAIVQKIQAVFK